MSEPEFLFKYVKIDDGTINMIKPNTFKFTFVSALNDIFDCKVTPNYQLLDDEDIWNIVKNYYPDYEVSFKEQAIHTIRTNINNGFSNKVYDDLINDHGVLCLSSRNDSILMWSHYADSFKGMCIGYKKNDLENALISTEREDCIKNAKIYKIPVEYQKEYPIDLKPEITNNYITSFYKYKHLDWNYENEIRFVYFGIWYDFKNGIVPLNNNIIKSITFGPNTGKKQIEEIKNKASGLNIDFYKAKKVQSSYKLDFERIN